jgi:hypothetical protein
MLALQLLAAGIVVDLSFSSIMRDTDRKLKFLRRSDKGTEYFHRQVLTIFMHIMTGTDKTEEQSKLIKSIA